VSIETALWAENPHDSARKVWYPNLGLAGIEIVTPGIKYMHNEEMGEAFFAAEKIQKLRENGLAPAHDKLGLYAYICDEGDYLPFAMAAVQPQHYTRLTQNPPSSHPAGRLDFSKVVSGILVGEYV
jgi:hypothetical protein